MKKKLSGEWLLFCPEKKIRKARKKSYPARLKILSCWQDGSVFVEFAVITLSNSSRDFVEQNQYSTRFESLSKRRVGV